MEKGYNISEGQQELCIEKTEGREGGILAAIMVPHPPLIVPEVGKGEEGKIQATIDAYKKAVEKIMVCKPETIVILSPHQIMYADYFHISPGEKAKGDLGKFRAGQVKFEVPYDTEFVEKLCELAEKRRLPAGTMGEREKKLDHGTMVPLYFMGKLLRTCRFVRIGLSGLALASHYELGECIKEAAEYLGRRTVIVASGDLSHRLKEDGPYGYQPEGPEYDERIMEVMGAGNFAELLEFPERFCEKAGECGHRSFTIMAGAFDRTEVKAEKLSYEGPFGVGYGVCTFETSGKNPLRNFREQFEEKERRRLAELREKEDAYVRLARGTIESYIISGRKPEMPGDIPAELLEKRAGAFVSIKKNGQLRGCIGTIQAVQPDLAQEIMENAVSAAVRDPRFSPIEPEELEHLVISVDVLGETEKISSPEELDTKKYGVIVTKGRKRGLLLPNLEGIDTVEEQIAIAKRKAGIGESEDAALERFEVIRHY